MKSLFELEVFVYVETVGRFVYSHWLVNYTMYIVHCTGPSYTICKVWHAEFLVSAVVQAFEQPCSVMIFL